MSRVPLAALRAGAPVGELVGLRQTFRVFGAVYLACTLSPLWMPAWRGANVRR